MGKTYQEIDPSVRAFIEAQRVFFVATAPLDGAPGTSTCRRRDLTRSACLLRMRLRISTWWAAALKPSRTFERTAASC